MMHGFVELSNNGEAHIKRIASHKRIKANNRVQLRLLKSAHSQKSTTRHMNEL